MELRQELEDLEQTRQAFSAHLERLEHIEPEAWPRESLGQELNRANLMLDQAEEEFDGAVAHFAGGRTRGLFGGGGVRAKSAKPAGEFRSMLRNGLAFNLPVVILGTLALLLYLLKMMGFFRHPPRRSGSSREASTFAEREAMLLSRITELERFIEDAPERIRREIEAEMTTMPAPDDLDDRRRERKLLARLTRGEIRNERRYQTRSTFLLILLVSAIVALSSWIYSVLQAV